MPSRFTLASQSEPTPTRTFAPPSATRTLLAAVALLGGLFASGPAAFGQEVSTVPVGAMTFAIPSGSPATPSNTIINIPLLEPVSIPQGVTVGRISAFTSNTLTIQNANWANGLSTPTAPVAVQVTSGDGEGQIYTISSNTADTLTVAGPDLTTLNIQTGPEGDQVRLIALDTLSTLLGSDTILGDTSPLNSDIVYLFEGGAWVGYYYNTGNNFWRRLTGPASNQNNTVLRPETGFIIQRKSEGFSLTFTGTVPDTKFRSSINNSGNTLISTGFPANFTLQALNLQNTIPGWSSGTNLGSVDLLSVFVGGAWVSYYHNGSFWRRTTGPNTNQNLFTITAGSPVILTKRGVTAGTTPLSIDMPYALAN